MKKKVAILGCTVADEVYALPVDEFEFWTVNNCFKRYAESLRFSRVFELHRFHQERGVFKKMFRRYSETFGGMAVKDYLKSLAALRIPIYMQRCLKEVPRSVEYPLMDILSKFSRGYFNNSIAWMLALAIHERFEEIHVYGVCSPNEDFREYYVHRISAEYYLGYAEAIGIRVVIPHHSDLLKSKYLYAYQEQPYTYKPYIDSLATPVDVHSVKKWFGFSHT